MSLAVTQNVTPFRGAEGLPVCHSRREFDAGVGTFFCAHPNVHIARSLVSVEICSACARWQQPPPEEFRPHAHISGAGREQSCWYLGAQTGLRDCPTCSGNVHLKVFACRHSDHYETTLEECRRCLDYEPRLGRNVVRNVVWQWQVGVTTAPRKKSTLARMLASLAMAGWEKPLVFAEPGSDIPGSLPASQEVSRTEVLGAWPNWYLGLSELYLRDPFADAYFMVQDDVLLCRNLREYLEAKLWPAETLAVLSLYNPLSPESCRPGFERYSSAGGLPGAQALVFPNAAARLLLTDKKVIQHRRRGPTAGRRLVDVVIGEWAHKCGLPAYLHAPSRCQHIGETTTLWGETQDLVTRQAATFVGEDFDAQAEFASKPHRITPLGRPVQRIKTRKDLLRLLPTDAVAAELGVLDGLFSEEILAVARPRLLYLVDNWNGTTKLKRPDETGEWVPCHLDGELALELAKTRLAVPLAAGHIEIARSEATAWLASCPAASLDWIYLDDDHTYQHVLLELELASRSVRPGGWILGHDYCEVLPGVAKAINEFCLRHELLISYLTDEELLPVYPAGEGMPLECSYNSFAIQVS